MIEFWNSLVLGQQIAICIALPSTLLLIIQIILMLIGFGGNDADADGNTDIDTDADSDGDGVPDSVEGGTGLDSDTPDAGLSFFTIRGIVSMLCITGWSGLVFLDPSLKLPTAVGIVISVALGLLTLLLVAIIMRGISKLQQSGNLDLRNAVGKVGQVYLTVPAAGKASGKVSVTIQEQYKEFSAITTSSEALKTGSYVRIVAVSEAGILVVEPIGKN